MNMNKSQVSFWEPPFDHGTYVTPPTYFWEACEMKNRLAADFVAQHGGEIIPSDYSQGGTLYIRRDGQEIARFEVDYPLC